MRLDWNRETKDETASSMRPISPCSVQSTPGSEKHLQRGDLGMLRLDELLHVSLPLVLLLLNARRLVGAVLVDRLQTRGEHCAVRA